MLTRPFCLRLLKYIDCKQKETIAANQQINGNPVEQSQNWTNIGDMPEWNKMTDKTENEQQYTN